MDHLFNSFLVGVSCKGNEAYTTTERGLSQKSEKREKTSRAKQSHTRDFLWDFLLIFPRKFESLFLHIEQQLDVLVSKILNLSFFEVIIHLMLNSFKVYKLLFVPCYLLKRGVWKSHIFLKWSVEITDIALHNFC